MTHILTTTTLVTLATAVLVIEVLYSIHKDDGAYSYSGTLNNFLRGGILILISIILIHFFTIFFTYLSRLLHETTPPTTFTTFLVSLIFCDFMYYIFHRLHHKLPFLRQLHTVHHSDTKFNLSTAFRISWLEQSYILFFLTPVILVGFSPKLVFLNALFLVTYQLICHSHYLRLPKLLNYLLVTPSSHKTHHDQRKENQNSNYGAIFTIWDRMFCTYTAPKKYHVFGIQDYVEDNFITMETKPVISYFTKYHGGN